MMIYTLRFWLAFMLMLVVSRMEGFSWSPYQLWFLSHLRLIIRCLYLSGTMFSVVLEEDAALNMSLD